MATSVKPVSRTTPMLGVAGWSNSGKTTLIEKLTKHFSDRGLRVVTAQSVLTGTPVRLELPDRLLLGDVCYCAIQGDFHAVGVRVSQSLEGLTGLRRLAARLMGEPREQRTLTSQP